MRQQSGDGDSAAASASDREAVRPGGPTAEALTGPNQAGPDAAAGIPRRMQAGAPIPPPAVLRLQRSAGNRAVSYYVQRQAAVPLTVADPLLVDAGAPAQGGQVPVTVFLAELRAQITQTVIEVLGEQRARADSCPWIDYWFGYYGGRTAAQVERAVRAYLGALPATTALDYIPPILERVRRGVAEWGRTGRITEVPADVPLDLPGSARAPAATGADSGAPAEPGGAASEPTAAVPSASAAGAPAAGGPAAPVQRSAGDPRVASMGPGRPIDAGTSSRMSEALGFDVSGVHIHDGPEATRSAQRLGARAYTVGQHVAFPAGGYRPGTLEGDAVLAHELAHTGQQRDAMALKPEHEATLDEDHEHGDGGALETDADRSAAGALLQLYGRSREALAVVGSRVGPSMRSGLRLRRCPDFSVPEHEPPQRVTGAEADALASQYQIRVVYRPEPERPLVGMTLTFGLDANTAPPTYASRWYVYPPGQTSAGPRYAPENRASLPVTLDQPGSWQVDTEVYWSGTNTTLVLSTPLSVIAPGVVAGEAFGQTQAADYTRLRAGMALHELELAGFAQQDQSAGGGPHISTSTANPIVSTRIPPDLETAEYRLHPDPRARRFAWYATAEGFNWGSSFANRFGQDRISVRGQQAYDLGSGPSARFTIYETALWIINCDQFDESGNLIDTVRYRHAVQTPEQGEQLAAWRRFQTRSSDNMRLIQAGRARGARAVHVSTASGRVTELALFVGPDAADPSQHRLIDITPGAARADYGSAASIADAIANFDGGNSYPTGEIRLEVPGVAGTARTLQTTGASDLATASAGFGWASLGLAGAGVLLSLTGVGLALVPLLFLGAAAAGGMSSGLSLVDRLRQAEPDPVGIALDIAGLAGSVLGAGQTIRALRAGGEAVALAGRSGRFLQYAGFATDTVQGVLLAVDSVAQIDQILNSDLPEDRKLDAIVRLLGMLALNGGMVVYGARRMGEATTRVRGALDPGALRGLNSDAIYHLNALDDAALARLRTASADEVRTVARLIGEDPSRAALLSRRYGGEFVESAIERPGRRLADVAEALEAAPDTAVTAGGTRTAGVYLPADRNLWGNVTLLPQVDLVFGAAGAHRLRANNAFLRPRAPAGAGDFYLRELVIPAAGALPEIRVPVKFNAVDAPAPTAPHGPQQGPADFVLRRTNAGWEAEINVSKRLRDSDFAFPVGHELDEIAFIVRDSRVSAGWQGAHTRPALYRPGPGRTVVPTPHDQAQARELVGLWQEANAWGREGGLGEGTRHARMGRVAAMMRTMGLAELTNINEKLSHLRAAGATEEMIRETRTFAALAGHLDSPQFAATRVGGGGAAPVGESVFSMDRLEHIIHPGNPLEYRAAGGGAAADPGDFQWTGVSGGHDDALLGSFVSGHPEIYLVLETGMTAAGCTYRRYNQYFWQGPGPKPRAGDPRLPGPGGVHDPALWIQAWSDAEHVPLAKTTFSDAGAFLRDAEDAFARWRDANPALVTGQRFGFAGTPAAVSANGVSFGGFFDYTAAPAAAGPMHAVAPTAPPPPQGAPAPGGPTWQLRTAFAIGF